MIPINSSTVLAVITADFTALSNYDENITNEKGQTRTITKDALGRLTTVIEPTGAKTTYKYDLFGNLTNVTGPLGNVTTIEYDQLGRKSSMDDPYMGHWEYKYDSAGNLIWQHDGEDPDKGIVEMTYDCLNRIETKYHRDTTRTVDYTYDEERSGYFNVGALTTLEAGESDGLVDASRIVYNYDHMGRAVHEERTIKNTAYEIRRTYELSGRLDTLTYPNGIRLDYDYTPMGQLDRVDTISADGSFLSNVADYGEYNALGQLDSVNFGNGAVTTYRYDPDNHRLWKLQTTADIDLSTRGLIQDLEYTFDDLGNVDLITDHKNSVDYDFDYDDLNRLRSATAVSSLDPERAYSQAYEYDLAGNMISKTGKGAFKVTEWEDDTLHIRPAAILYGGNGAGVGPRDIIYNQDNKPTSITYNGQTSQLTYDGAGNRMTKIAPGGETTVYVGGLYEVRDGQAVVHIFAAGKRIASIKGGQKFFTHGDHLGSSSLVTDQTGLLVEETGYLPFGATLFRKAYNDGQWTSVYTFTGQEFDGEFGLYNFNARLYDPVTCRFISADTVVPDWSNPQTLNRYAYCGNNPLKYVDPSGHEPLSIGAAIAIAAIIGAFMGGMSAMANGGNVIQGMINGGISGAISGAMFYSVPAIGAEMDIGAESSLMAALHVVGGAVSGTVNAVMTGGDIGQGALIGALSAGAAKYFGGKYDLKMPGRMMIGAATGGLAAAWSGGDVAQGAFWGAWTSAIADICNRQGHDEEFEAEAAKMRAEYAAKNKPVQGSFIKISRILLNVDVSEERRAKAIESLRVKIEWIKEEFRFHPERAIAYLQSDYVQGKFKTFSWMYTRTPTIGPAMANNLSAFSSGLPSNSGAVALKGFIVISEYYKYKTNR